MEFNDDCTVAFKVEIGVLEDLCQFVAVLQTVFEEACELGTIQSDIRSPDWFGVGKHIFSIYALWISFRRTDIITR